MTFDERTAAITRIAVAQNELLDHSGHVRSELDEQAARRLLREINQLRRQVAWPALSLRGRRRSVPAGSGA